MDVTFQTKEGRLNYRACAVILQGDAILAMRDERSPYYYLPGGRVRLHETAEAAVLREIREELGVDAEIVRPLWMNQSFFTEDVSGERYHELCVYFLTDITKTGLLSCGTQFTRREQGRLHRFEWLPFAQLEDAYFYPLFIKRAVFHLPEQFTLLTTYE